MSMTYPVPGSEQAYPAARFPDLRLRVVPNESVFGFSPFFGELVQSLADAGADKGISIELDTSDQTRPDEMRGGASPMPIIALAIISGVAGAIADRLIDVAVAWVRRHLRRDASVDEFVTVRLYGPDGEVIREVRVTEGENP